MGHSQFSPSSTEREYSCPASFRLNQGKRDDSSIDADHGTAAHHIGELCLRNDRDVDFYAGCIVGVSRKGGSRFVTDKKPAKKDERTFEVDDEMIVNVQKYVEWCRDLPGEHHIEVKVEHTDWCPDTDAEGNKLDPQYGTSDHNACIEAGAPGFDESTLVITDLKYGRGVKVDAKENKQAIKYALGVWKEYDWLYGFKRVIIRICQPRIGHFDVWELTVEELLEWGKKIKKRLELVFVEDPPFGPSEKACKFCKASPCKAAEEFVFSQNAMMFDEFAEPAVNENELTPDELFAAYRMLPMLEIRKKAIERRVAQLLGTQEEVGDLLLVTSVTHRAWKADPEQIEETLESVGVPSYKLHKKELKSPKQIEDMLPKNISDEDRARVEALWFKPEGRPVIASPSDKRPRYEGVNLDDFDEYEGE